MGLLSEFSDMMRDDIELYNLGSETNDYGQTITSYPATASDTITGLVQPRSGSAISRNGGLMEKATYVLYTEATILQTDRIKQDGKTFGVVFVQPNGVGGIDDHSEVYLEVLNA